jgi:antitoxin component YwqK of YwqJK toxin-antitoxin module
MKLWTQTFFFCCFLLTACDHSGIENKSKRNENWIWWVDNNGAKGEWIPVHGNGTSVLNGSYTKFYADGSVYQKGKLSNGKESDTIFNYAPHGELISYVSLSVNPDNDQVYFVKDGPLKIHRQNGSIVSEGIIEGHTRGRKWTSYFENGRKLLTIDFVKDTLWQVSFYENGNIQDSGFLDVGNGILYTKKWYPNKSLQELISRKNGKRNGVNNEYYENGQIKRSRNFINDVQEGTVKEWNELGQLESYSVVKNGKLNGPFEVYYPSGKIKQKGVITNNKVEFSRKYDEEGNAVEQ